MLVTTALVFLVTMIAGSNSLEGGECYGKSCYFVGRTDLTWPAAQLMCQTYGLHLATIETQGENDFLKKMVRNKIGDTTWIGATDELKEGNWIWVGSGNPITKHITDWASNQPNNWDGIQHCMVFYEPDNFADWHDVCCGESHYYICEDHVGP